MRPVPVIALSFLVAGRLWADLDKLPRQNFGPRPPTPETERSEPWSYRPTNIYQLEEKLPVTLRRVAVLPVTVDGDDAVAEHGRATQEAALRQELGKCYAVEVVTVSPAQLTAWTGRAQWTAEEKLPTNLLSQVRQATGAEAVLFARLTQYRPYRPVAVGWSLKLVDLASGKILWAADEVFDAGDPKVVRATRRYAASKNRLSPSVSEEDGILLSPSRFGQYAAAALLRTLPGR